MPTDLVRYDLLVQEALKSVVRKVLADAVVDGLPGEHHFYISFRTEHPGVKLSQRLREKYPQDMTIVLQHQFDQLTVTDVGFEVGLSFSGFPERLRVPFDALTGFFDPSVQFGLKFENTDDAEAAEQPAETAPDAGAPIPIGQKRSSPPALKGAAPKNTVARLATSKGTGKEPKPVIEKMPDRDPVPAESDPPGAAAENGAQIVSLDSFRKKS